MSVRLLELKNIECRYGSTIAVKDLSFRVYPGDLICLLGPSGCGKSTVLRAIAGLEPIYNGQIILDQKIVSSASTTLAPEKRGLGMVFQDYALFPHMNIEKNVCFGVRHLSAKEQKRLCDEMLGIVGLGDYRQRYPHELSGGQQQRVALARALIVKPKLILMDEPFSNLDIDLRERLSLEVREILKDQGLTGIMVTHDQSEAFAVADKIAVLYDHTLQQWDTAYNLYHGPINRFVADFIGQGEFLKGRLLKPDTVETEIGILSGDRAYDWPVDTAVDVLIRPDDIVPQADSALKAEVKYKSFKGSEIFYQLQLTTGGKLLAAFPSHFDFYLGEIIGIDLDIHHLIAFKR